MVSRICSTIFMAFLFSFSTVETASAQDLGSYLDHEQVLSMPTTLMRGSILNFDLPMTRRVQKIDISAFGIGGEAMFEVIVNGEIKGTVHVPGQDPRYWVTVADATRTITLRHLSGGAVRLQEMTVYFDRGENGHSTLPGNGKIVSQELALKVINKVSAFQSFVGVAEFKQYGLPIKIAAGYSYAIASASGDLSIRLRESLDVLQTQFKKAHPFFESLMARPDLFDRCVEVLELEYELDELLN